MLFAAFAVGQDAHKPRSSTAMRFSDVSSGGDLIYFFDASRHVTIRITHDGELLTSGPITKKQATKKLFLYYSNLLTEAQDELYALKHRQVMQIPPAIRMQTDKGPSASE